MQITADIGHTPQCVRNVHTCDLVFMVVSFFEMEFYLLLILVGTTCGKVAVFDELVHTIKISKDDSNPNITAFAVATEANPDIIIGNVHLHDSSKEHVLNGDPESNTDAIKSSKDDENINVDDFLITVQVGNDNHVSSTTAKPAEALNTLDVDEHVSHGGPVLNTEAAKPSKDHENITDDDFLITVQLGRDNPVSTTTAKPAKMLDALDVDFLSILHVANALKPVPITTPTPVKLDPLENALDVDFLNIISDYEDTTSSSETIQPKVDNGTALLLTPFIKEGRIAMARNACRVDSDLFLGFESYSGFLTVDESLKSHLFFWYFPVPDKPVNETPWIVWLQGGPGASSLVGLFDEVGPITVSPYGTLKKNRHSWIQNHSLLFIDNPVGTGYSFTESPNGYAKDQETYATHLHIAMNQFIQIFPELQSAPLFIAGESYAGKYVPALAHKIHRHRDQQPHFNLQGVMLGNAMVDPEEIAHMADSFEHFGLVDQTQVALIRPLVDGFQDDIAHNRSTQAKAKWVSLVSALLLLSHQKHAYNFLSDRMSDGKFVDLLDKTDVKRALHVGDISYSRVNVTVNMELAPEFLSSTKWMLEELLDHYKVLMYCGHLDQMLPCLQTSRFYRTWKWNGTEEFSEAVRYPYMFNSRNAGYHKTGGRLTEVVFRGAGHMVPQDVPGPAKALVTRFTHGLPLGPRSLMYEQTLLAMQKYLLDTALTNVTSDSVIGYL